MLVGPLDFRTGSGSDRIIDATVSLDENLRTRELHIKDIEHRIRSLPKPKLDVGRLSDFRTGSGSDRIMDATV